MKKTIKKAAYKSKTSSMISKNRSRSEKMVSLKKLYLKSNPACKVTFRLPKEAAPKAQIVSIVGDFNNWNVNKNRMTKLKSGDFKLTLKLSCNKEYRFRYLIDADRWENDWFADKYIPNPYGTEDSVVVV